MKLANLTLIVTDDCNFNCSYCFQKKVKNYIGPDTIKKAVDFLYPYFIEDDDVYIVFYGGEPLLAFEQIEYAVSLIRGKNKSGDKKIIFSLTSNGSLITEEMLRFLNEHRFSFMLSFDGQVQDEYRQPGTMLKLQKLIERFLNPDCAGIKFETNSVFTPTTIEYFFASLRSIIEIGVHDVQFSLDAVQPWDQPALTKLENELKKTADYLLLFYREKGTIPLVNFRPGKQSTGKGFACTAGRDRLSISPKGNVYGCFLFHDYLIDKEGSEEYRNYSFGKLEHFIDNFADVYPAVIENYSILRQISFFTEERFCFLCEDVKKCGICPVMAARSTSFIGKIPSWTCRLNSIRARVREDFLAAIEKPPAADL